MARTSELGWCVFSYTDQHMARRGASLTPDPSPKGRGGNDFMARYFRLWLALVRFSLAREMAFRANFVVKMFVEVLWLSMLLIFYDMLFSKTSNLAEWS